MNAAAIRIALAASWRGRSIERRRAAVVALAAGVVVVTVLGCLSALAMSQRIDDRATARAFRPAGEHDAVALERAALFDETPDGDQIYVYWWRVNDPDARIPGVSSNPPVGSWFISPALAEGARADPSLASRYPNAEILADDGVAHRGELLAYRFVGPHVQLDERLTTGPGDDWIGDGTEAVDAYPIFIAGIALVGVPGVGLLLAALSPAASSLARRLALLDALGATPRTRRATSAVQALLSALPGVIAGGLAWYIVAPRRSAVPLVGRPVFPGDLALGAFPSAGATLAVLTLVGVLVAMRPADARGNRPTSRVARRPTFARAVPLACGVAVMATGVAIPGRAGAKLFLVGVIAATVGAVVAMPYLFDRAGRRLAASTSPIALLVGRRLSSNAVATTRSLLTVGTLAAVLPLVGAWVAVARTTDRPTPSDRSVVELRGSVPPDEAAALSHRLGTPTLVVVAQHSGDRETLSLVGNCSALMDTVRFERCDAAGFSVGEGQDLAGLERLPGAAQAPPSAAVISTLFFAEDARRVEQQLRAHVVNASHTGMQVLTPGRAVFHESPLVHWILGAAALAGIVGGLALVLHLAGQAARLAPTRLRLLALGCSTRFVRRLAAAEAAIAVAAVGLGGSAVGYVSSWLFVQRDATAGVPYLVLALVVVGVLTAAAVSGVAAGVTIRPQHDRRSSTVSMAG